MSKKETDLQHFEEAIERMLYLLFEEKRTISMELGLMRIGAIAGFQVECLTSDERLLRITTYIYPQQITSDLSLEKFRRNVNGAKYGTFYVTSDELESLPTIPDAIRAIEQIRDYMNSGLSYLDALSNWRKHSDIMPPRRDWNKKHGK